MNIYSGSGPSIPLTDSEYVIIVIGIISLVLIGGLVAGLTIGLMSLDVTNLSILKASGTPNEKLYAARIEPIRKNGHLLLVTLLLVNTMVNESLPILFDTIHYTGWKAVVSSTFLIFIFGEIIPQAVCAKHGLIIGAFFAWPVRILMFMMGFISYPISKLLDWLLGHKKGMVYRHAGLKELVALHGEDQAGPLSKDEVMVLRAVLDLRSKTVQDVMTSMQDVFMLPSSQLLDRATISSIIHAGHSRIPVYLDSREFILGTMLVKQLILNGPDEQTPISALKLRKLPRVRADTPLFEMLHVFEAGASHMALVVNTIDDGASINSDKYGDIYVPTPSHFPKPVVRESIYRSIGIITLEDVIEEMIGSEIVDETDVYIDVSTKIRVARDEYIGRSSVILEEEVQPLLPNTANIKSVTLNNNSPSIPFVIPQRERKIIKKKTKQSYLVTDLAVDLLNPSRPSSRAGPSVNIIGGDSTVRSDSK